MVLYRGTINFDGRERKVRSDFGSGAGKWKDREFMRAYAKAWRAAHPGYDKIYKQKYTAAQRDKRNKYFKDYRAKKRAENAIQKQG